MRAVNLLPRDGDNQGRKLPGAPALVACGGTVVLTLVLALSFLSASSSVGDRQQELADAQARLAAIPSPAAPPAIVSELPQQKQSRVGALATVLNQRIAFDRILRQISQVVPNDVWLRSLTASTPAPVVPGAIAEDTFSIVGYTYSQEAVARFLARLEVVPDITEVTLNSSANAKIGERPVVEFTISAKVRGPGVTS